MSTKRKSRGGRLSLYSPEFRRDALGLVPDEQRAITDVAGSTGVKVETLGNWVRLERIERGERAGFGLTQPGAHQGQDSPGASTLTQHRL